MKKLGFTIFKINNFLSAAEPAAD